MKDSIQTDKCICCHTENPEPLKKKKAITVARGIQRKLDKAFPAGGWAIQIWHNIHWCWAVNGYENRLHVYGSPFDGFSTLFNTYCGHGGYPEFSTNNSGLDVVDVVRKQLRFATKVLIEQQEAATTALQALKSNFKRNTERT